MKLRSFNNSITANYYLTWFMVIKYIFENTYRDINFKLGNNIYSDTYRFVVRFCSFNKFSRTKIFNEKD